MALEPFKKAKAVFEFSSPARSPGFSALSEQIERGILDCIVASPQLGRQPGANDADIWTRDLLKQEGCPDPGALRGLGSAQRSLLQVGCQL